ncbi:MAG: type IV secretory system conjugative DNA transfer family protein [Lysobacterales bacterium]
MSRDLPDLVIVLSDLALAIRAGLLEWAGGVEASEAVPVVLGAIGGVFALRTVYGVLARWLGLYSPEQYRWFPRLPWRAPYRVWAALQRLYERTLLFGRRGANGGFASALGMFSLMFSPGMVFLGRAYAFGLPALMPMGISPKRHLFAIAQTGSGKTVLAITMIAMWYGSAFIVDPKAQIVRALYGRDARRWFVIDPDHQFSGVSAGFNPFDWIKDCQERFGAGAAVLAAIRIAQALVATPSGNKSPFFYDLPRHFLAGVIWHVLTVHPEKDHNLPYVRDLLIHGYRVTGEDGVEATRGDEAHQFFMRIMSNNPAFEGVVAGAASAMSILAGETLGSTRATLLEQTKWLDIPNVRAILRHSDFSLFDLKRRDDIVVAFTPSIYSVREELSRFARMLTNLTAYSFELETQRKGLCLMAIDELPSQGYNPVFETLLAISRSQGLIFFGIAQSVELMRLHYPNSYRSFIGEADATWWMGGTHPDNRNFLAELLGKRTLVEKDRHTGRKSYREVAVMEPEQIGRFLDPNSEYMIVTRAGKRPLQGVIDPYYKALSVRQYTPDPDHREVLARRVVRALIDPGIRHAPPSETHAKSTAEGVDNVTAAPVARNTTTPEQTHLQEDISDESAQ